MNLELHHLRRAADKCRWYAVPKNELKSDNAARPYAPTSAYCSSSARRSALLMRSGVALRQNCNSTHASLVFRVTNSLTTPNSRNHVRGGRTGISSSTIGSIPDSMPPPPVRSFTSASGRNEHERRVRIFLCTSAKLAGLIAATFHILGRTLRCP